MGDDVPITSRGVKYTVSLKVEIDSRKQMDWPSLWRRRLLQKRFLVFWWTEGYKKLGRRRHFGAPLVLSRSEFLVFETRQAQAPDP